MNGVETMTVWLVAILCLSLLVRSIVHRVVQARVMMASFRAQVDAQRTVVQGQVDAARAAMDLAHDPMFVPPQWGDEL